MAVAFEDFASAQSLPPRIAGGLGLALEEAVTNVLFYAFENVDAEENEIVVTVERRGDSVHVCLRDNGRPFDPTASDLPEMPDSLDGLSPGGLGIRIIRKVANRIDYRREDGFNHLELELSLGAGKPA